jgi:hypothetical protein
MASTDLDVQPVTPNTPTISRTTNVPSIEAFSWRGFLKITAYEDFGEVFTIEDSGGSGRYFISEFSSVGDFYIIQSGGTSNDYWIDTFGGWSFVGAAGRVANCIGYFRKAGGTFGSTPTVASPAGANNFLACGASTLSPASTNGHFLIAGLAIYNVEKTQQDFINLSFGIFPRIFANLVFFNSGLIPGSFNVDQSGTGGSMTLNGAPASSNDWPGVSWRPLAGYGYGYGY